MKSFFAVIAVVFLAGCIPSASLDPLTLEKSGVPTGEVYVFRDQSHFGFPYKSDTWYVVVDGHTIAGLKPGEYTRFKARAGTILNLTVKRWDLSWEEREYPKIIEPDAKYYILTGVESWATEIFFKLLPEEDASAWLKADTYVPAAVN